MFVFQYNAAFATMALEHNLRSGFVMPQSLFILLRIPLAVSVTGLVSRIKMTAKIRCH